MGEVATVRGPIGTDRLGQTLMHEHVFVITPELIENYPDTWDEEARVEDAVGKLTRLKALGIDTIVDPTVVGLGRSIPRIQRINEHVDINIVVATGLYTFDELPFALREVGPGTPIGGEEPMVDMFVKDLTEGIAGTAVRAGFLKCAIDRPGLTDGVGRVLRAVARAHLLTGAPITVHTDAASESGTVAQAVLRAEGVDLGRVVIGHSGDSHDLAYLASLADAGSYLGMDRFGVDRHFDQRVDTVAALCARGYADRLVLSHDGACYIDWFPPGWPERVLPDWNYELISRKVLPALSARGVTEDQVRTMLVDNPRRYFEPA